MRQLWSRTLRPEADWQDRGRQGASIPFDGTAGTLVFETISSPEASRSLPYWGETMRFERDAAHSSSR